jgi:GrpB-like predicted nucleotidyltransferase (UPF0157 family)
VVSTAIRDGATRDDEAVVGLERHRVHLADHHPAWAGLAGEVCREVIRAAGGLITDAQHVGSTAVPGLVAKPILDIAAQVLDHAEVQQLIPLLESFGLVYRGDGGNDGGHLFVRESSPDVKTVHLHVVAKDDPQWEEYLLFRDLLRGDPGIRQRYGDLKEQLAERFPDDRESYTSSKCEFIRGVLDAAGRPTE